MFTNLQYTGVKGMSGSTELERVTVVCGPNESGKSAAANAMQLAVTGRCEIGAIASAQLKLLSGSSAVAVATGKNIEASWSIRSGKKVWEDPGTQGGMPVTVDEFWGLTGAQRLQLLVPEGALASIQSEISKLDSEKKRLKTIIDATAPPAPEEYNGLSVDSLQQKLSEADRKLSTHSAAKAAAGQMKEHDLFIEETKVKLQENEQLLESKKAELASALQKQSSISAQFAIYGDKSSSEPRIIKSARERGVTIREAIESTMSLVQEAMDWAYGRSSSVTDGIQLVIKSAGEDKIPEIPESIWEGKPVAFAKRDVDVLVHDINTSISHTERFISELKTRLERKPPAACSGLLSADEAMAITAEKDFISKEMAKANAWTAYNASLQKMIAARIEASQQIDSVSKNLELQRAAMTNIVDKLKGTVEELANSFLSKIGKPELSISVSQTAKGWVMDVSIGDVALEAMARSRRLLYGLCILSAIHEASEAKCPILIAECAEMQPSTLDKCIDAMSSRTRGNVILEHWHKPNAQAKIVEFGTGDLS